MTRIKQSLEMNNLGLKDEVSVKKPRLFVQKIVLRIL
jgi:hypothetical protein